MPVIAIAAAVAVAAAGATAGAMAASQAGKGTKGEIDPGPPPALEQTQEQQDIVRAKLGNQKQRSLLAQMQGGTVATGSLGLPAQPAPLAKKSLLGQ